MSLKRTTWMHHVVVKATAVIVSFVSNAALGQGVNTVVGWGYNGFGQCSPPANLGPCLQVAGGGNQTAALQNSGAVIAWGLNAQGQCNVPKNLGACLQVAAGTNHTAAISNSGIVVAWGDNSLGQCGTSTERVGGRPGNSNSVNGALARAPRLPRVQTIRWLSSEMELLWHGVIIFTVNAEFLEKILVHTEFGPRPRWAPAHKWLEEAIFQQL